LVKQTKIFMQALFISNIKVVYATIVYKYKCPLN
jgi:hypothetical protein